MNDLFDPMGAAIRAVQLARAGERPFFEEGPVGDLEREALAEGLPLWLDAKGGHLYLAANASWPGLYKIGCTRRSVEARMRQLSGAGMATPWVAVYTWHVHDAHGLEAVAHRACKPWQVKGELFDASCEVLRAQIAVVVEQDLDKLRRAFPQFLFGH